MEAIPKTWNDMWQKTEIMRNFYLKILILISKFWLFVS